MSCKHCENGHEHHEHGGEEHQFLRYLWMGVAAVLLLLSILVFDGTAQIVMCIIAYLAVGWPVLKEAGENILHGEIFDENFLMSVASIGAFCIGEYPEAAAVMLLYSIGETLQDKAVDRSRRNIEALVNVRPDSATLCDGRRVPAAEVAVGTLVTVRPGERIPLDGVITDGTSGVDTSALTGESMPRQYGEGDTVLAGCIVLDGVLTLEVTKPFADSAVSRIMAQVQDAQENKARPERFITRFSRIYTPIVCGLAVLVAILPPILGWGSWNTFIHKALAFLVISCPCALVISVPLSFFSGIGCAGHNGILLKGGNHLETLSKATVAAFDKTGTLTHGEFQIVAIEPCEGITENALLELAAHVESQSTHPLAKCIVKAYHGEINPERLSDVHERSGYGVEALYSGHRILAGKRALLADTNLPDDIEIATAIYIARDGRYLGRILLADTVKDDACTAIEQLHKLGFTKLVMLSGDRRSIAESIAMQIGLDHAFGELLPEEKVKKFQELKADGISVYAGDGINDAPVLATADVGIAMGGLGADAAMEAADVVIMSDEPGRIPLAVNIARKTMRIAKENIIFSLSVKAIILLLSILADIGLWLAVFADVGVCMIAIANSLRALHIRK